MSGAAGLDPGRAAEVITTRAGGAGSRGSGYLVTRDLVLTAAHVLADAASVRVRFDADRPGEWSALAEPAWLDSGLDIALLRIEESSLTPQGGLREVAWVRFGWIARPPVECEALGFPLFKLRTGPLRLGASADLPRYRDSHHAIGTATSWSNRREGTLEINVRAPEPDPRLDRSPWEGMSGAAVFSGGCLIGVIGEHHRSDGPGTLAAYRVDHWYEHLDAGQVGQLAVLTGLPARPGGLTQVTATAQVRAGGPLRQLPATTPAFTGREAELAELLALANSAGDGRSPGTVVISAIDGMAGIGKTALAIHAGHALAARFPDGQLFVDLHGYTRGMTPQDPLDALAAVLQAYGATPGQIPLGLDARAAAYRDRLAGTRTLIILDNASSEAQVRPLLPGDDGCLVVITSRRRLNALDDAHTLPLDVLPMMDAVALFRQVAGRTPPGDPLLEEIAALCGRLPLALRIAAALIRRRPAWTLEQLTGRLREAQPGLEGFSDGDRNLASVFDLSYEALSGDQQFLFRRLALAPGPDVDACAAAALLDSGLAEAEGLLQGLVDHSLLAEPAQGRYRMHDLVRIHARTLVAHDPADQSDAALERLLDYYQHTAARAEARVARRPRPRAAGPASRHTPAMTSPDAAWGWLRTERANLEACLRHAVGHGQDTHLVAFSAGLASLLDTDGPWPPALKIHAAATWAAGRLGDRPGLANALTDLGQVRMFTGDYAGADRDLQVALELYRELDDRLGQAGALTELGQVRSMAGDYPGGTRDLQVALELYRELDDRLGQAGALTELGRVRFMTGDYPGAARDLQEALELHRELGNRLGQASALIRLGQVRQLTGDYAGAARDLEEALELYRGLGDRRGQANALNQLGEVRRLTGDYPGAARDQQEALELFQRLGSQLGQANTLTLLGRVRQLTGNYVGAARDLEEALELFRGIGSRGGEAWALNHYAAALAVDEPSRALAVYRDALRLNREVQQPDDEALSLEGIGECLLREGAADEGAGHLAEALVIFQRLGMHPDIKRVQARMDVLTTP